MKKVRAAIVGPGFIAHYHARALLKIPETEIVVVCGRRRENTEKFAAQYGIPQVVTDIRRVAAHKEVDLVILAVPNKFHAPYALTLVKSGKDVFIEKPLAMNTAEGETLRRQAQRLRRIVMTGHMWRFDTEVNYIRQVVQSGLIGKVVKTKGYGIHVNWGPAGWFAQKKLAGGGALADMGVHPLDTVRHIMGDPKPVRVYASIGTYYGAYDVDDTGLLLVAWNNGAVSLIESGWWQPHMDGPEAATRLYGTRGYASLFPTLLKFKVADRPGEFIPPMPARQEHCDQSIYDRQMEHFISCVRERRTPSPGLEEGLTILRIVDAAYRSSRSGQAVKL